MLEVFIGGIIIGWLFYKWWTLPYEYWKKRNFPYIESSFPFGIGIEFSLMKTYLGYGIQNIYNKMNEGYVGINVIRRPVLFLKDPEIIKLIMVKDFHHFTDRIQVDNVNEPLSHHIFNLGGDKWKALRVKLTPTFTTGKLKLMFPLFEMCSRNLEETLQNVVSKNNEINVKDIMGRYTTKIVGTCAYGIDIDTMENDDNEFVKITQKLFSDFPFKRRIMFTLQNIIVGLEHFLKPKFLSKRTEHFLTSVVLDTMSHREGAPVKRNDFIDLLTEIREQGEIQVDSIEKIGTKAKISVTDMDLVAQVFVFLAAGFETSSSVTSYCLYELAENQDIQDKLRQEILSAQPLNYQSVQDMTYLDKVVHETMRKYPTLPMLTRKCTKQYQMPDGSVLEKGIRVIIPTYALHHDPNYFPNPSKFDPERFNQENKSARPQFAYLPFGEGPRLCIGMRFGLLQTKMGITTILSKFRIEKTANTVSPMQFIPTPLISNVGHSIKLAFIPL